MTERHRVLDVSAVEDYAFGHQGLIWWGTLSFMIIEGTMFVVVLVAYYYLRLRVDLWPPSLGDPALTAGTINLALAAVTCVPAHLAKVAAEKCELRGVHIWLTVLTVFNIAAVVVRGFEFPLLNCRWDDNAYGSIVWLIMGMHTVHLATDMVDSAVLTALMFTRPPTKRRFVDVSENSLYWYFIAAWWVPVYVTIYLAPKWL
jgi:cytochrome c oxidase subunit III